MSRPKIRRIIIIFVSILSLVAIGLIDSIIQRKQKLVGAGITKAFLFVLINLHIIAAGVLLFLIIRQSIKLYTEHRNGIPGAIFKRNLLFAFTLFSVIPALFVFFTAGRYITANIDRWFQARVTTGFTSGMIVHQEHAAHLRNKISIYGARLCNALLPIFSGPLPVTQRNKQCADIIKAHRNQNYTVYILSESDTPTHFYSFDREIDVWRSFRTHNDRSMHSLKQAFLMEVAGAGQPEKCFDFYGSLYWVSRCGDTTLIIAARYPKALRCALIEVQNAYADYAQLMRMRHAIKLNYTFTFILLFLLIVFLAIWCAFYLARGMVMPIQELLQATEALHKGDLSVRVNDYPSSDLRPLLFGFNQMSAALQLGREHLEAKNREISALIEYLTVAIIVLNRFGRIIKANPAAMEFACVYLGSDQISGRKINVFGPTIKAQCSQMVRSLLTTRQSKISSQVTVQVNGEQRSIMFHVSTISLDGDPQLLIAIEDISTAVKANKLKTWQEAAQQIAHEIKNPLTPIQLATQRLQRKYQQSLINDPLFAQSTRTILDQVKIIQELVQHFSAFASMPKLSLEQTNLARLIGDIMGLYTLSYPDISFLLHSDPQLTLYTDQKKLSRAIINILDNSVRALITMPPDNKKKLVTITVAALPEQGVLSIIICDNGPGIAPEIKDKLFLPYVSSEKKNMGLGLAIVQDSMQQLNGSIVVTPQEHGAAFQLILPLTQPQKFF